MELDSRRFGNELTNRAGARPAHNHKINNKRKFESLSNDDEYGPTKQIRRLNNYNGIKPLKSEPNSKQSNNIINQKKSLSQNQAQMPNNTLNNQENLKNNNNNNIISIDSNSNSNYDSENDIDEDNDIQLRSNKNKMKTKTINNQNNNDIKINNNNDNNKINNNNDLDLKGENNEISNDVSPWDKMDASDDLFVVQYVNDIIDHLRFSEISTMVQDCLKLSDYMSKQRDITSKMRLILLDWMIEVHRKFGLLESTLHLCVELLDRFLNVYDIHRSKLQLAGCCALWIASKYHEIYAPEINDFVYISDNAFTSDQLTEFETTMLAKIGFKLTLPTPLSFAQRYIKVGIWVYQSEIYPNVIKYEEYQRQLIKDNNNKMDKSDNNESISNVNISNEEHRKSKRDSQIIENLVYYLIEHCLMNYNLSRLLPSQIAAAALAYTLLGTKLQQWPSTMIEVTGYTLGELLSTIESIDNIVKNPKCKHKAVRKKYSSSQKCKVALLQFDAFDMALVKAQVMKKEGSKKKEIF